MKFIFKFYSNWDTNYPSQVNTMDRCTAMRGMNGKWFDIECLSPSNSLRFICQKETSEQNACTQYVSSVTGAGGHCVHKNQCPDNFFVSNLCNDYNDADIQCCLNNDRCNF